MDIPKAELLELCKDASKEFMSSKGKIVTFAIPGISRVIMYNQSNKELWIVDVETFLSQPMGVTSKVLTSDEFNVLSKKVMLNFINANGGRAEILN